MLSLKDIEKYNIFTFLSPFREKIKMVFEKEGTAATARYIYRVYRVKMTGAEIREFINVESNNYSLVIEAHRIAWSTCGWNGSISVIATHKHMDTSGTGKTAPKQQPKGQKKVEPTEEAYDEPQIMANQKTVELLAAGLLSPGNKLNIMYRR
ncbi:MAG: hypothetical protein ACOY46_12555 [Bacillota bacterium]